MKLIRKTKAMPLAATLLFASGATYVAVRSAAPREKVVSIVAKRFEYLPGHLTLKKGEPVILELTSRDVLMGFNLPDFKLRAIFVVVIRGSCRPSPTGCAR